jgi:hypothetical protein
MADVLVRSDLRDGIMTASAEDEVTVDVARVSILRRVGGVGSSISSIFTFVEAASGLSFDIAVESVETLPSGDRISSCNRNLIR